MSNYYDLYYYIRRNRDTYTREAITDELLKKGYSQSDIDSAWDEIWDREQGVTLEEGSVTESGKFWWGFIIYFIVIPVIIGIIARIVKEKGYYMIPTNSSNALLMGLILSSISAAIISAIFWNDDKALSRGVFYGCLFATATPVVTLLIVIGICSAG